MYVMNGLKFLSRISIQLLGSQIPLRLPSLEIGMLKYHLSELLNVLFYDSLLIFSVTLHITYSDFQALT